MNSRASSVPVRLTERSNLSTELDLTTVTIISASKIRKLFYNKKEQN